MVSNVKNKTILITGGAGAIGCHIVRRLALDNNVIVLDNLSSGHLEFLHQPDIECVIADIRDIDKLDGVFESHQIDVVIHLAAHFANQNSVEFPLTDANVNIVGTLNLLQRCQKHGTAFVYASSSCVYGQKTGALSEDMVVDDLHTPYALSKYGGELYTKLYAEHFGVRAISLRFFNSFGPYEMPGRYRNVIPNFVSRALKGEPLVITGTGAETRDFNYVENTASAIHAATLGVLSDRKTYAVYNVGTGIETTVLEMAQKVIALCGDRSKLEILGARRDWDQTTSRCANIQAIQKDLQYSPQIDFDMGLEKTVDWLSKQELNE